MTLKLLRAEFPETPTAQPKKRWRDELWRAVRGFKSGIRSQSNCFVHFFSATLVAVAGLVLQCEMAEWCMLIGCIGLVMIAELFNAAIETLHRELDAGLRERTSHVLEISAGAVLAATATALSIGSIVVIRRLVLMYWGY